MSKEFSIRALYDMTQKHIRALRALSVEVDKGDAITIHLIKGKLNNYVIEKWEESTCNVEKPTLKDMLKFLERRSQVEETRAAVNQTQIQKNLHVKNGTYPRQSHRSQHPFTGATTVSLSNSNIVPSKNSVSKILYNLCKGEHGIFACSQFLNSSPKE